MRLPVPICPETSPHHPASAAYAGMIPGKGGTEMFDCDHNNGIVWIVLALAVICWCRGNGGTQNGGCGSIGCGGCGGCR